jgi:4,5-dihydroxyphthalate decarboxylase
MSNPIPLTLASLAYDRTNALSTGEVAVAGASLNFITLQHPRDIFDRMAGGAEFDASELSLSEYICRYSAGRRDLVAIPAFPSRAFRHGFVAVNTRTVGAPADLNGGGGRRIGVQLYTMTAAVWIRAVLKASGVDLGSVTWVQGSMESGDAHGRPSAMPLTGPGAGGVTIVQNTSGKSLSQLLEDGEIDATIGADLPGCLGKAEHVRRLFPDFKEVEKQYYRETGIFPIMHTVVIRRELVDRHPWLATSLFNALNDSKEVARIRMRFLDALRYMLPWMAAELDEIDEVFEGGDPFVYGVEPNRKTLEALVEALYDQSMISTKPSVDELFAPIRGQNWKVGWGTTTATR